MTGRRRKEASAEIVKNVYGSGVGRSMDAVAEAVIIVKKNLGDNLSEYAGKFEQAGYSAS